MDQDCLQEVVQIGGQVEIEKIPVNIRSTGDIAAGTRRTSGNVLTLCTHPLNRVFRLLDPAQLETAFRTGVGGIVGPVEGLVASDGNTPVTRCSPNDVGRLPQSAFGCGLAVAWLWPLWTSW